MSDSVSGPLTPLYVLVRTYIEENVTFRLEDDGVGFTDYHGITTFDSDPYYTVTFTGDKDPTFVWTERVEARHMADEDEFIDYVGDWTDDIVIEAPDHEHTFPVSIVAGSLTITKKEADPPDHHIVTFSATINIQVDQ